ncbi:restriction endonuclease subunit S [Ligilactobacillus salivarius]|uniref:restriction endonuclease subunit S n=3 Tax=Ligilactobacillus salivarius TaxID=1624 RepID=UPI00237D3A07|nr:restriction endonuclease subunit S [Ligilactobacillus salivarius]MDE1506153.1 restriction endonuclease subunit S [Ligilactobacillus salivarius]MDE1520934.1 restriction endonuclease subunit S [Ligilactobacillus salivarius]
MVKEEKKAPKLRFNGYTNDWEHVKSKYLFENISLKGFQDLPVLSVTQDKGVVYRDNLDIDIKYDLSTLKNYKLVQPGDFIISLRSFQGGFETSYLTGITSPAYTIFNFIDNQDKDHAFWQYLFKRIDFINSLKRVTFGIRDGKAISFSQFGDVKVKYPSFNEQKHIATALTKLDNTIQLHERKCEELALIKKALLQKLFPKKDEVRPEVRYKNFSDAWEQRKLGEVIISEHKGKVKSIMKGGNTNYLETNYLNGGTAQKVDALADVSKDDVLILWDGSKAGTIYHGFEGALGSTLKAYVPKYSGDFLYQILKKNQDKIYQSYRTPNIPHVIKNFTEKFNVSIPTIIEQQEIGDFFKQLDSLITLHQRKLEKLKQLKKFLLQNMFI